MIDNASFQEHHIIIINNSCLVFCKLSVEKATSSKPFFFLQLECCSVVESLLKLTTLLFFFN